ncbi:GDP-fucose protein O-fucosyltransferase 4-like [Babylonia areolata]|uniref:GDP-fucose protein O-fucosyltransferase 4-like n=1 Tax=Babylonia areolata TaxID=304850 RepID=UPI003FD0DDF9
MSFVHKLRPFQRFHQWSNRSPTFETAVCIRIATTMISRRLSLILKLFLILMLLTLCFPLCKSWNNYFSSADNGEEFLSSVWDYMMDTWPGYHAKSVKSFDSDFPVIVWWSDKGSLCPHTDGEPTYAELACPNGATCYSTTDRDPKLMNDPRTRGFLFYGTDLDPFDLPLPRLKHHEWALIHEESPLNNYILTHNELLKLINHTSTFRRESDYPLSTQAINNPDFLTIRQPVSTAQKNEEKKLRDLASVVYVQSHCDVPSDRDSYVKELMKYIKIDSYGACLHNKDLPSELLEPAETFEHKDFYDLLSVYKFTLAFENAYCNDYMTEKIMRPLHIGVVPIYKGSPVVQDWMPNNHSVILVDDFKSPKELADFIKYLDENDDEYEKYLEFKKTAVTNTYLTNHLLTREWSEGMKDFFRGFECHLCKQLSDRMEREKLHAEDASVPLLPPRWANISHLGCPAPERLDTGHGISEYWPDIDWTALYWDGLDKARAMVHMLEAGETNTQKFNKYHRAVLEKYRTKH